MTQGCRICHLKSLDFLDSLSNLSACLRHALLWFLLSLSLMFGLLLVGPVVILLPTVTLSPSLFGVLGVLVVFLLALDLLWLGLSIPIVAGV